MGKIKLEFETDLSKLENAGSHLQQMNHKADDLGNSLTNNFKKAGQGVEKFDDSLKKGTDEVKKLSDELRKSKQYSNFTGQVQKVNELKEAYKTLSLSGRENSKVARGMKEEYQKLEKQLDEVVTKMNTVKASTVSTGSKLSEMATGFVVGSAITGGIQKVGEAFTHAINLQREFEKSIQNLSAITGAEGQDLEFYSEKAIELGVSVKGGAVAAVEAFKLIGSAKPELLANKDALVDVTKAAILLSQATGLELPDAATRLTDAMNQFGAASDQAGLFVDTLAAGAKFGAAEVPQITEALLKFGAVAKSSNISVAESTAAIELLAEKGLKGAEAGTALRNVLLKMSAVKALPKEAVAQLEKAGVNTAVLGDKSKTLVERLTELAKIQGNETALVKVFGTENVVAAKSIIAGTQAIDGHIPRLKELTDQIGKQGFGAAAEQAAKNMDTLDQAILETGNKYDNLILSITKGDFGKLLKGFVKDANIELGKLATQISDIGTLFAEGFGALKDKKILEGFDAMAKGVEDRAIKSANTIADRDKLTAEQRANLIKKTSEELRHRDAEILSSQIRNINIQLQANENLTDKQKKKYLEQLQNKAKLVNALLALDKKSVAATQQINTEALASEENDTEAQIKRKLKLREDYEKAVLDLRKRVEKAQLDQANPEEKINLQKQFDLEEIDLLQNHFLETAKLYDKNFKLSIEQEQQFAFLRQAINQKAADDLVKLEVDKQNRIAQAKVTNLKGQGDNLALEQENAISSVSLSAQPKGVSDAEFERAKQKQILEIKRDYAIKTLEQKQAVMKAERDAALKGLNGELELIKDKDDEESNIKRENIRKQLALLEEKYNLENTKAQDATALLINDLQKQLSELDKAKKFSLASLFGLTSDDMHNLSTILNEFVTSMDTVLNSQLANNEKVIKSSQDKQSQLDSEISDLQSQLDKERGFAAEGLANNTSKIQGEINAKEAQKAKEKEIEIKAIEERKKIQKEKLALDTGLQASNLAVAATEIYAKAAAATGPLSIPIAIAAIAAMIAGFTIQKAQAFKAINDGNGFYKGVVDLNGPGTGTSDSINARLSKGESVMRADITREHKPLLEALHKNDKKAFERELLNELSKNGISLNHGLPKELSDRKHSIKEKEILIMKNDNSKMEKQLSSVNNALEEMMKAQRVKTYIDHNGHLVKKVGTHTSIIRKRNE